MENTELTTEYVPRSGDVIESPCRRTRWEVLDIFGEGRRGEAWILKWYRSRFGNMWRTNNEPLNVRYETIRQEVRWNGWRVFERAEVKEAGEDGQG